MNNSPRTEVYVTNVIKDCMLNAQCICIKIYDLEPRAATEEHHIMDTTELKLDTKTKNY